MSNNAHSSAAAHDGHGDHGLAHVASPRMLISVWLCLITLTGLTVWTASMHLHPYDLVIAIVIATVKALLVALFFMHLKYDRPFNGLIFMLSFVFAAVFVMFSMFDTGNNQGAIMMRGSDAPYLEDWRAKIAESAAHTEIHAEGAAESHEAGDSHESGSAAPTAGH